MPIMFMLEVRNACKFHPRANEQGRERERHLAEMHDTGWMKTIIEKGVGGRSKPPHSAYIGVNPMDAS